MYHAVDAGMIRLSAFPSTAGLPSCPAAVADAVADAENCRKWISRVWDDEARASAIELAAPVLAATVRKVLDGTERPSRVRRAALSLTRYLLRMRYRATPFGLFAGPAPVRLGAGTNVRLGARHRTFARADASWLHDVITALEQDPDVLRHLSVTADPTRTVRGPRIAVPHQPGPQGPTATTLRRTRAAETALGLAHSPARVGDLVAALRTDYPDTPPDRIEAMVRALVAHRVLLTGLHAPMTCDDALGHLVTQLDGPALAATVAAPAVEKLRGVQRLLLHHDRAEPGEQHRLRAEAAAVMNDLGGATDRSFALNLRPDCDVTLPVPVAQEAQRALETITRITPYPHGTAAWIDYRARFLERYSTGTVVPVRELTDPDTGLGFPVGYRGTVLKRPVLPMTPRDEYLLALAQDAALTGRREIVLRGEDIEALSSGTPAQVPAHIEFHFNLLAPSTRAVDDGRFTLAVKGLSLAAGVTTGRFLTTLDEADFDRVSAVHAALPTLTAGAVRGQVSGPPLKLSVANVGRAPLMASELISVGEHNPAATLHPDDLGVLADSRRLYLVALSTGRIVEPSVMNAVELGSGTHPLIRFLSEVHRSHTAALLPFSWGLAGRLPFLPEVRTGRTVLSPARWYLRARDLGDGDGWRERLAHWRRRYGVPGAVYAGRSDRRLRLDLDDPAHQEILHADLNRFGTTELRAAPDESAWGWIGRAHEVTMLFASDQEPLPAPTGRSTVAAGRLPGSSERAYVKLYGSTARMPDVLTAHIPRLLDELDVAPADWWFVRYADPEPHLRLRLRLPGPGVFGTAARQVAEWAAGLRDEGLIQRVQWDTDHPETGRYGTGAALEAAEAYFAADSQAALAQLGLDMPGDLRQAVTAASFVDIATGFLGSRQAGIKWLLQRLPRGYGEPVPRDVQRLALRLTGTEARSTMTDIGGGAAVSPAWERRRAALDLYRRTIESTGADPATVLSSLLHMHHNRVAGIDRTSEATCRRLARTAALSWEVRTEGDEQ
ncbi:lantibiotic dehydratase [Streptomyces sp. JNUCC 64]